MLLQKTPDWCTLILVGRIYAPHYKGRPDASLGARPFLQIRELNMSLEHSPARTDKRSAFRESLGGRQLIKIADAAIMLANSSVRTLERWHRFNPDFPRFVYIGNRRYLDLREVEEFIAAMQTK